MIKIENMPKKVEQAIKNVLVAKAKWEATNSIDKETKIEILKNNIFTEEESGKRIKEINADFLMSEADFKKYLKMVYARNCEKGIDSGSWEVNFWDIHKAVYNAEDLLIDTISSDVPQYTPEIIKEVKTNNKMREKFLAILGL